MTADEFVKVVRSGSEKLRVDDVVINTGNQDLHGKGMLTISHKRLELKVTINQGENVPEARAGIYTKRDSWKLAGIIEDQLHFKCDHVGPVGTREWSFPGPVTKCTFRLNPIDLIPSGLDAMTRVERDNFQRQLLISHGQETTEESHDNSRKNDVAFYATLIEYPLFTTKSAKETWGDTDHFKFQFTKDGEDADLQVVLHSKENYHSDGMERDWSRFHAFMKALAFVTGIHAWPYRVEYWREGQKITDRVTAARRLAKTAHAPFSERLAFNAKTGSVKWDLQETLGKIAIFFERDTALSKEVAEILHLFREADDNVHSEITIIALCTLFENVVRLLFKELKLREQADKKTIALFDEAKAEVSTLINGLIAERGEGYRRLHNIVRSAQAFSIEQMFQAVVNHFGLKWQDDMERIFKTWKLARNPIVHDKTRAEMSEDELKSSVINESQIAGAINIMLLKLVGYSGHMRSSALEDGYRQI